MVLPTWLHHKYKSKQGKYHPFLTCEVVIIQRIVQTGYDNHTKKYNLQKDFLQSIYKW